MSENFSFNLKNSLNKRIRNFYKSLQLNKRNFLKFWKPIIKWIIIINSMKFLKLYNYNNDFKKKLKIFFFFWCNLLLDLNKKK